MEVSLLVVAAIFTAALGLGYGTCVLKLRQAKNVQPFKSRAPRLLMFSSLCNTLGVVALCLAAICIKIIEIESYLRLKLVLGCLIISEVILIPLLYATYFLRHI